MTMLIFYLSLSIGVSFLCSLYEAVILSISPAYVASVGESDKKWGKLLKKYKVDLDDSLAAILTLNTISHTIGAAGVGAEVLRIWGDKYVAIASAILTILILLISEIIPKTLGASHSKFFAPFATYGIRIFIFITYPFVIICNFIAQFFGASSHLSSITREEVAYTASIGQEEGTLSEDEALIIKNLLRLRKVLVTDVMTPRTVVFALEESTTIQEVLSAHEKLRFSRIPVYSNNIDKITGLVVRYDMLSAQVNGQVDLPLSAIKKPVHAIPDSMNIAAAFDLFIRRKEHLFSVLDEHGGFDGVVTLEDVIETLLGVEITDEFDSEEDMRAFAKKQWEMRSSTS